MAKEKNEPAKYPEVGARLTQFVEQSGEPSARQFAIKAGITASVLSNLMLGYSIPGGETLAALATAYPKFDATWLLTGRVARVTTPAEQRPQPDPPASFGTDVEVTVLRRLLADSEKRNEKKDEKIAELNRELGKPFNGLDAAGPTRPTPRNPIGFGAHQPLPILSVSHRVASRGGRKPVVSR